MPKTVALLKNLVPLDDKARKVLSCAAYARNIATTVEAAQETPLMRGRREKYLLSRQGHQREQGMIGQMLLVTPFLLHSNLQGLPQTEMTIQLQFQHHNTQQLPVQVINRWF